MKSLCTHIALLCGLMAGACFVQAQTHYPAGAEGIKGSSLPPPGFYLRDYNYIYFASKYEAGPPNFDLLAYVQVPRLIWITGQKVLGGYYGMDIIVPFTYQDLDFSGFRGSNFKVGDIFVEPITLSWHLKQFDYSFGYGFWAPTAHFSPMDPLSTGKGFWGQMLTGGITYYPDKGKTWSFSALNRYEFNQETKETKITPGQHWTLEWALAKSLSKTMDLGIVGYHQLQTTSANGPGASTQKDRVNGIGPEITIAIPKLRLNTSVKYFREVGANQRPEGNTVTIIFTRRF